MAMLLLLFVNPQCAAVGIPSLQLQRDGTIFLTDRGAAFHFQSKGVKFCDPPKNVVMKTETSLNLVLKFVSTEKKRAGKRRESGKRRRRTLSSYSAFTVTTVMQTQLHYITWLSEA